MPSEDIDRLRAIYERFKPEDVLQQVLPHFTVSPQLLDEPEELWHEADHESDPNGLRVRIPAKCCDSQKVQYAHQAQEWEQDAIDLAVRSSTAATIHIACHAHPCSDNRHDYPGHRGWKLIPMPPTCGEND